MPKQNPSANNGGGAPIIKVNSNPNPAPYKSSGVNSYDAHEYRATYKSEVVDPHYGYEYTGPDVVKINTNPSRVSPSLSQPGKLGGQHTGGHAGH